MAMEPVRVAQIMGKMLYGGTESFIMNYYRHIDRSKIQFDFIADSDSIMPIPRIEEIESLGGRVFIVPPYQKLNKYIPALVNLFKEQQYQIVHSHLNTLNVFSLYAAKKAGVPVRIAHNHSTAAPGEWKKNILKYTLRPFAKVYATHYAACSKYAGEWLFGKKSMERGEVTIFNNAIDLDKFKYDENVRNEVRKELGLEEKFVIGNVGRFCYQKNQEFLIDVFEEVYQQNPNAVLMLVGDGPDREKIEEKVKQRKLSDQVLFLENRNDASRMYQAMDVFVFPSRYEGFGMVAVEAQFCGVRTVMSDRVPDNAKVLDSTLSMALSTSAQNWADSILEQRDARRIITDKFDDYDISKQSIKLVNYYEKPVYGKERAANTG